MTVQPALHHVDVLSRSASSRSSGGGGGSRPGRGGGGASWIHVELADALDVGPIATWTPAETVDELDVGPCGLDDEHDVGSLVRVLVSTNFRSAESAGNIFMVASYLLRGSSVLVLDETAAASSCMLPLM